MLGVLLSLASCRNHSLLIGRASLLSADLCDINTFPWSIKACVDFSRQSCQSRCPASGFTCSLTCNFSSSDSVDVDAQCDRSPRGDCRVKGRASKSSPLTSCSTTCVNDHSLPGWATALIVIASLIVLAVVLCCVMCCSCTTVRGGSHQTTMTTSFDVGGGPPAQYAASMQAPPTGGYPPQQPYVPQGYPQPPPQYVPQGYPQSPAQPGAYPQSQPGDGQAYPSGGDPSFI
jgi:hypothetical protein